MTIKDRIIKEYPLTKKIVCDFECYEVLKRRYVIFFDTKIQKDNIESLLNTFESMTKNGFSKVKTLIVVGDTDEEFKKEDLLFFNGVDTFVVFYLKNTKNNEIYCNHQRVFWFSIDWKKIINKFNEILKNDKMGYEWLH